MKVAILAGGLGTRLQEETQIKPKPMVEIGGRPILWHIMKIYSHFGFKEFVIALGYRGGIIKDYFLNYRTRDSNLVIDLKSGDTQVASAHDVEDWKVHLIDTGIDTMTGGRIKRVADYLGDEPFMVTYGDGIADINLKAVLELHQKENRIATVSAVRPPARFGQIRLDKTGVIGFAEKPQADSGWINGGFFVLDSKIKKYINDDDTVFEREPLERLAQEGMLSSYQHDGFWQCMDTVRDVELLQSLWASGNAPWRIWK
ncbi:glucose-1-phosphate cytidylyltransferase [bacterium]|nr:glucose-1-phosphate cytidylyltransferase [bacterium]QQR57228.1 MAG: glucose-1-phosphate cytidylyltransferase [Candidatus Melainabacteria bacterium]